MIVYRPVLAAANLGGSVLMKIKAEFASGFKATQSQIATFGGFGYPKVYLDKDQLQLYTINAEIIFDRL